jgi:hypothetical protein
MHLRTRTRTGTAVLASLTVAVATAALLAPPPAEAGASTPAAAPQPVAGHAAPGVRTVTLLTGDRVVLRTSRDGKVTAALTPGSPHVGRRIESVATPAHTWVVPQLAASVRSKLDNSVFDVSALAAAGSGRVPLSITFARGTRVRDLPGIDVRTGTSRRRSSNGRTTALASYDARRPLPSSFTRSLAGVSRISLRGVETVTTPSAYDLHTLTIDATTTSGDPLDGADLFLMNTDDGRLMSSFGAIVDGQWKVSVPEGHYIVICSDFEHVVVDQPVVGAGDTTTSLSMAEATVKPRLRLPDHSSLGPSLDLIGSDTPGHGFIDYGFGGFLPKVNPVSDVVAGTLVTEVANLWSRKGYSPYVFTPHSFVINPIKQVAAAKEVRSGIPTDLSFTYQPSDFAKVDIRHYATGPKTKSLDGWYGLSSQDFLAFISLIPTVRPSVVHAWFEGGSDISWNSMTTPSAGFRAFGSVQQQDTYRRGEHATVRFFRGPVTPLADRGDESGGTGFRCSLCVHGDVLHGFLSMLTSAGTRQFGFANDGTWTLARGHTRLAHGATALAPFLKTVDPGAKLSLYADTGPQSSKWTLSSQVHDRWTFTVPATDSVIPILRADYVPPTNLESQGRAGKVSFPITFDNLGPVDARIQHPSVRFSADGKKWRHATLKRKDGNTFQVSYTQPTATKAHPYLSLQVTAADAAGRTLKEQVANAYLLPKASSGHVTTGHHAGRHRFRPAKVCRGSSTQHYSCFVRLDAQTRSTGRASPDPAGWGAPALRSAYGLTDLGQTSTVAVIVAFDYPSAEADLNHYRAQFGLPACTSASGCFTKLNQRGEVGNYPRQDYGWGVEASLDLQMISAACPACHIVLVEANSPNDTPLGKAEHAAIAAGATVTNHSFGRLETTDIPGLAATYDQPGVTAVASTGDSGYQPAQFPAGSPSVVAVGGTTLARSATDPRGWREKAWSFGGSGCSAYFDKPGWQTDTACHNRTAADVSAVARGLAIYNTSLPRRFQGWLVVDGTSASSPLIAGMIGGADAGGITPAALYGHPADFNDVVAGSNGFCRGSYVCTALPGYDAPTGVGSPKGLATFQVVP